MNTKNIISCTINTKYTIMTNITDIIKYFKIFILLYDKQVISKVYNIITVTFRFINLLVYFIRVIIIL